MCHCLTACDKTNVLFTELCQLGLKFLNLTFSSQIYSPQRHKPFPKFLTSVPGICVQRNVLKSTRPKTVSSVIANTVILHTFFWKKSLPKLIADILLISMPRQDTNFHWYIEKGYYCYRKYEKTRIYTFDGHLQWRIQDFPEGGPPTPEVGMLTYHFANFLPETAWKWKNLDSKGGACPWQSPHLPSICQCSDLRLDHMVRFFCLWLRFIYMRF